MSTVKSYFILILLVLSAVAYIGWRVMVTIPLQQGVLSMVFGIALVVAETTAVAEAISHFINMQTSKTPEKPDIPDDMYPDVDILIATHNEGADLLYKTLNGCLFLKYPDKSRIHIFLCDDTDRAEMRRLAERMGVGYFGLSGNKHAKAGNLNNAISKTSSPLVATLDADMIPKADFLIETVPYFFLPEMIKEDGVWRRREQGESDENAKVGFVQTPQSFYNADLFQFNLHAEKNIPNEQDFFFHEVNVSRNISNSVIYAGSNTLISREALKKVGGITVGTITEDFATGLNIQSAGYITYAIKTVLAHGLAPNDYKSLIKQRQRWARGCVQALRSSKFMTRKMPLRTKVSYAASFLYWWSFARRFIYVISPILFVVFGIVVVNCEMWELLMIWLPFQIIYTIALKTMSGNIRNPRWSNITETIMFPYLIVPVVIEAMGINMKKFSVTPKTAASAKNSQFKYAIPHILMSMFSALGIAYCLYYFFAMHSFGWIIIFYWLCVNLNSLMFAIVCIFGRVEYRENDRFYAKVPVSLQVESSVIIGETADLSEAGMSVLLENPEYLPYKDSYAIELTYKDYHAQIMVTTKHVRRDGDVWRYGMKLTGCTEENRRQYLQIVYDREHTLPKSITSNILKDIAAAVLGLLTKRATSHRKLPRIPTDLVLPTESGQMVELISYNYEYVMVKRKPGLEDDPTILWGDRFLLRCQRVRARHVRGEMLFRIEDIYRRY